jgi:hypothetical protein
MVKKYLAKNALVSHQTEAVPSPSLPPSWLRRFASVFFNSCIFQSSHGFAHLCLKLNPLRVMVPVLLYGKRDSLSCDISNISNLACSHFFSVIHRGIHRGDRSA